MQPRDKKHPYGYGRYETLGAMGVSTMLMAAGAGIAVHSYEQVVALASHAPTALLEPWALGVVVLSILTKEWLFRKTAQVGLKINSQVVLANAWHHRSDALSSVVAFGERCSQMCSPLVLNFCLLCSGNFWLATGSACRRSNIWPLCGRHDFQGFCQRGLELC